MNYKTEDEDQEEDDYEPSDDEEIDAMESEIPDPASYPDDPDEIRSGARQRVRRAIDEAKGNLRKPTAPGVEPAPPANNNTSSMFEMMEGVVGLMAGISELTRSTAVQHQSPIHEQFAAQKEAREQERHELDMEARRAEEKRRIRQEERKEKEEDDRRAKEAALELRREETAISREERELKLEEQKLEYQITLAKQGIVAPGTIFGGSSSDPELTDMKERTEAHRKRYQEELDKLRDQENEVYKRRAALTDRQVREEAKKQNAELKKKLDETTDQITALKNRPAVKEGQVTLGTELRQLEDRKKEIISDIKRAGLKLVDSSISELTSEPDKTEGTRWAGNLVDGMHVILSDPLIGKIFAPFIGDDLDPSEIQAQQDRWEMLRTRYDLNETQLMRIEKEENWGTPKADWFRSRTLDDLEAGGLEGDQLELAAQNQFILLTQLPDEASPPKGPKGGAALNLIKTRTKTKSQTTRGPVTSLMIGTDPDAISDVLDSFDIPYKTGDMISIEQSSGPSKKYMYSGSDWYPLSDKRDKKEPEEVYEHEDDLFMDDEEPEEEEDLDDDQTPEEEDNFLARSCSDFYDGKKYDRPTVSYLAEAFHKSEQTIRNKIKEGAKKDKSLQETFETYLKDVK